MWHNQAFRFVVLVGVLCFLWACPSTEGDNQTHQSSQSTETKQILRVGFIPSENMSEIQQNAQPLVNLMSQKLGMEVQPFIATDYTGVVEAFRANKLDTAFLTPASYVMANSEAGVKVILKAQRGQKPYYYSVIFAHKDAGIKTLADFKNKTFAFGDNLSTAGYIYPLKLFKDQGINPSTDFENLIFSGGHDATVLAVYNQKVVGGATYANDPEGKDAAWSHLLKPEESAKLQVIAVSEAIPADNICVSSQLKPELAEKVKQFFMNLSETEDGQKMIKQLYRIDKFVPATDSDYQGIRDAFGTSGIELKQQLTTQKSG